jgi:2-methylcitrate dehydratase PrpD
MKGPTQELVDFVTGVTYGDLTPEVIHVTKRIFLDSIGVGIAALKTGLGDLRRRPSWGRRPG